MYAEKSRRCGDDAGWLQAYDYCGDETERDRGAAGQGHQCR